MVPAALCAGYGADRAAAGIGRAGIEGWGWSMGLAAEISPHLPYLRRFSRSLTGSQQSGDAYVAAVLETLIADPAQFDAAPNPRAALYRTYCKLWESVTLNMKGPEASPDWEASAKRHLSGLRPKAREAFLLMAVEGFSKEEIGAILSRDPRDVASLLEEASKDIVDQVATNVLIIEDEPIIAMDLETLMESLGHKVTGVARTEKEAIRLASAKRPGLVLADIQLADGSSGIDAVNKLLHNFEVPVVFITAFPERLLTGVKPEPAFLITKPFMPDMVKAVVSQALFFDTKSKAAA
jgi:DNA-directed RNA polymerase specialized sigma24 family protein/CheY-like chemotaxis protein